MNRDGPTDNARPRVGLVSYLNSRPIGFGIIDGRGQGRFTIVQDVPSKLADELARGAIDLALLPSVEYARAASAGRSLAIVPGIAIASRGPAESVLVFSRVAVGRITTIALDTSSRTSAALFRVLWRRRWGRGAPEPDMRPSAPDLPEMLAHCDAALVIGDRALFAAREHPELVASLQIIDLGAEWSALTNLPFVFAFWAGPPRSDSPRLVADLQDSLAEGLERLDEIVGLYAPGDPSTQAIVRRYLSTSMRYTLGLEEIRGLKEFYRLLAEERLIEGAAPRLVFHRTDRCAHEPRS